MDPNYLVKSHLGGFSFAIPYAYESWRSTPERVNCAPVRDTSYFAFWMPDLRPSVKDASHRCGAAIWMRDSHLDRRYAHRASWPKEEKNRKRRLRPIDFAVAMVGSLVAASPMSTPGSP
jgi:hypothetical protein